ncbi:MAG: hypothetical protein K1X47_07030 [Cyclobacteriaceae bacterium]|nr:hypothetical protein [Cyclobacteriaceae bacterium]
MNVGRAIVDLFRFDRTNWKAVALCVLTATVFWFFNALNKTHTTTIAFPLQFEYDQDHFIATSPLPQKIHLEVTGGGWDLLRKSLGFQTPVVTVALDHPIGNLRIAGNSIPSTAANLKSLQVNRVVTDTLRLQFDARGSKVCRLSLNMAKLDFKDGFGLTSPVAILPDSVTLSGPAKLLSELPDTLKLTVLVRNIHDNIKEIVVVDASSEYISRNPPTVNILFEVGEVTVVNRKLPVIVRNAPKRPLLVNDDSVEVALRCPAKLAAQWKPGPEAKAEIDLSQLQSRHQKLPVAIKGLPDYIQKMSTDSVWVTRY